MRATQHGANQPSRMPFYPFDPYALLFLCESHQHPFHRLRKGLTCMASDVGRPSGVVDFSHLFVHSSRSPIFLAEVASTTSIKQSDPGI